MSIGWSDVPAVENQFREPSVTPSHTRSDSFSAEIANRKQETMKNTKFVVKVNRGGTRAIEYVTRIDRSPVGTTLKRNLALLMGKWTAEDVIKSLGNSRCSTELVPVQVNE
jgi:hypothetical protein